MSLNANLAGWFSEVNEQWPGVALSFKVDEVLWDQHSQYQHVQVSYTAQVVLTYCTAPHITLYSIALQHYNTTALVEAVLKA